MPTELALMLGTTLATLIAFYGTIVGIGSIPEITQYRKRYPRSITARVYEICVKPFTVPPNTYGELNTPSSTPVEPTSTDCAHDIAQISHAWVLDIIPGKLRIPGNYVFCFILLFIGGYFWISAMIHFDQGHAFKAFLYSALSIISVLASPVCAVLVWGQVFRRVRITIHEDRLYVDDIEGRRVFRMNGRLKFSAHEETDWLFGKFIYIQYDNIAGPRRRLLTCPLHLAPLLLQCPPKQLVSEINSKLELLPR